MNDIDSAREAFVAAIMASEEYQAYAEELDKVKRFPELKAQIDDYRERNFVLQTDANIDFEKLDRFEKEYEAFRENSLVADFLAAELGFCRMVQMQNMLIIEELHFE